VVLEHAPFETLSEAFRKREKLSEAFRKRGHGNDASMLLCELLLGLIAKGRDVWKAGRWSPPAGGSESEG